MPQQPFIPFAQVAPGGPAAPQEHVQANPDAFGASIGAGMEKLGAGAEHAGESGLEVAKNSQNLFNEARVNEVQSKYIQNVTDALYKPASSADADDGGFYTKRGDSALLNYEGIKSQMDKIRNDAKGELQNPRQQVLFDNLTRRMHDYQLQDIGRHVDREINQAADQKTQAVLSTLGQTASLAGASGNMDLFNESIDQGMGAAKEWGHRKGYGKEWGDKYSQQWVGQTVANSAGQLVAAGKYKEAAAMVAKYEPEMDKASTLSIKTKLKSGLEDMTANNWARNAVWGTMDNAPDVGAIGQRITQVEGTGQNPNSTAAGTGQFIKSTWLETVRNTRPDLADKPDEELLAMRNDPKLAGAMTENYAAQNAQALSAANLPPTPGNVYLAHFLGPTGAIKTLSADPTTPIETLIGPKAVAANPQLQGKTAGDVATWANGQMAGIGSAPAVKAQKASALMQAQAAFPDDPAMQKKVIEAVNRTYTGIQLDATARAQEAAEKNQKAYTGFANRILANDPDDMRNFVRDLHDDKDLTGEHKITLMNAAEARAKKGLTKDDATYGSGFSQTLRAIDAGGIKHDDDIWKQTYEHPVGPPDFALTGAPGMKAPGNIEVWNRPVLKNPDGGYSTTSSMSIGTDDGEVLIPTVINGKRLTEDEAIAHYKKTGENLGTFDTPENADKFATDLHNAQATMFDQHGNPRMQPATMTAAGAEKASAHLKRRYSPKDFGDAELDRAARQSAESILSNEMEVAGIKIPDPVGKRKFENQFLPAYYGAIQAGVDKGLTYSQMLTEGSKDYIVGPLVQRFKPTPAEATARAINARDQVSTVLDKKIQAPPPPPVGQVVDGYRFKGGNPADENSWEQVAAPTAPVR